LLLIALPRVTDAETTSAAIVSIASSVSDDLATTINVRLVTMMPSRKSAIRRLLINVHININISISIDTDIDINSILINIKININIKN